MLLEDTHEIDLSARPDPYGKLSLLIVDAGFTEDNLQREKLLDAKLAILKSYLGDELSRDSIEGFADDFPGVAKSNVRIVVATNKSPTENMMRKDVVELADGIKIPVVFRPLDINSLNHAQRMRLDKRKSKA